MTKEEIQLFVANEFISLIEVMKKIDANACGILFMTNSREELSGVISDGDIRRWIIKNGEVDIQASNIMNRNPKYVYESDSVDLSIYMEKEEINVLPIVSSTKVIKDLVFLKDKNKKLAQRKCLGHIPVVIMAGGKGTRLYPFTKILPKPLIPIGDIPIIERIMNSFSEYGVTDFYVSVNYKKNMIFSYFTEIQSKYNVIYIEENEPLGTAGSIRLIETNFDTPLFVINCDILIRADYNDIYNFHKDNKNDITIVTALKNNIIPYGVVHSTCEGNVREIEEKPCLSYFVNTGMYIINPEIITLIPSNTFFHMTDLVALAIQKGYKVSSFPVSEDSFLDMGELAEMKRMEEKLNID